VGADSIQEFLLKQQLAKGAVAGAVILGAAGAAFVLPKVTQAADPSAQPSSGATTPSAGGTAPSATDARHPRGFGADDVTAAAKALGMTEADVTTAVQGGQTLAQIAATKGVAVDTLINAMVAAETTEINDAVKAGTMTQAQADQRLADLKAHETAEVNGTFVGGGHGRGGDHGGPGDGPAASASPSAGTANG
jgi:hypothetical protein